MAKRILISWIGFTDLRAPDESAHVGLGPIAQAVKTHRFDEIVLLSNYPEKEVSHYIQWLKLRTSEKISPHFHKLTGPTNFGEIYEAAVETANAILKRYKEDVELTFHLSPGTPAMAAVWIILAKTRFPAGLIESSKEHGVRIASVPFDISADFIPDLLRKPDKRLEALSAGFPPEAPAFKDLIHRSRVMKRVVAKAQRVAPRSVPVLIEGESGTGKELLARAIHKASPRRDKAFVAVNCGAIPAELIESELFGHEKGAFTGADQRRVGYFEQANQGTLFLDEIGELPLSGQVKILRALQEGELVRVGSTKPISIDVRIIAATNRTLTEEIASGKFRSDLFYRVAVAVLHLPPIRERQGDLSMLIDHLLKIINEESTEDPGYKHKKLSASAKNFLISQVWPGNVRELQNTLVRAAIWSGDSIIRDEDVREALLPVEVPQGMRILEKPLGDGLDLPEIISTVAKHYLRRAMDEAHGNKTIAAKLVGLPSYQTFTNWVKRYDSKNGTDVAVGNTEKRL